MTNVPFLDLAREHASLVAELDEAAQRVLRSGRFVRGPEVDGFENEFAEYCGGKGAVGVANGTDALQLVLVASGIGRGDEVIVSAHTSIATWLAISHAGAKPVPIEPDQRTMVIDAARVADAIGPRTAAIVPVHLYGMPADMDALGAIARKHGLRLVEDASQAHGARLRDRPLGSSSDAAAFSLYPTKNLGAVGDAGVVVSNDAQLLDRVRMLGNYGEQERYQSEVLGRNSRLDELQAALLRVKLRHLDQWNATRRARAAQYLRELQGCSELTLPDFVEGALPVWHQFVVRVRERERVRAELARNGVGTLVHYPIAPHQSALYAPDFQDPLPITEYLARSVLSLPISSTLTETECSTVCERLLETLTGCPSRAH